MWGLVLSAVTALAPKLFEKLGELWNTYGEKFLIYRKGAVDQHRKDSLNQMEREAQEAHRAQDRVTQIQKDATDKRGTPADGSDLYGGVRDSGKSGDWFKP